MKTTAEYADAKKQELQGELERYIILKGEASEAVWLMMHGGGWTHHLSWQMATLENCPSHFRK